MSWCAVIEARAPARPIPERVPVRPAPPKRLMVLWLLNAITLAGVMVESPVLGAVAIMATMVMAASFVHWRYRVIMEPARRVALAFIGQGPLGEAARDLSEAVFIYDSAENGEKPNG